MQTAIKRIIFFAAIIAFWEIGSRLELWHPLIFPSLSSVFSALAEGFQDKTLIYDLIASFKRLAVGLTISLIIGTLIGILLGNPKRLMKHWVLSFLLCKVYQALSGCRSRLCGLA